MAAWQVKIQLQFAKFMTKQKNLLFQVPPQDEEDIDVEYDQEPNMFEGVEELIDDGVVTDGVEVVEEEIVGIDDDEVVSWDAVVGEEVVEEEVVESSEVPVQPEPGEVKMNDIQTIFV